MEHLINDIICFPLPDDATDIVIDEILTPYLQYWQGDKDTIIDLPPGSYQFLFTTGNAGEEEIQDSEVVEMNLDINYDEWWYNYVDPYKPFKTAKQSLQSLLTSKSLTGNQAIIKKL